MNLSDESAAAAALAGGDRARTPDHPRRYALALPVHEVRWVTPQSLLLQEAGPTCDACGIEAAVMSETRRCGFYVYELVCACGADRIITRFPLQVGSTIDWWRGAGEALLLEASAAAGTRAAVSALIDGAAARGELDRDPDAGAEEAVPPAVQLEDTRR